MNNMEFWNKVKTPPADVLKTIQGGRLKGMTDISPQWRYQVMTELFGSCGVGWKYTIDRVWTEQGTEGQVFAFAEISLFIKVANNWSDPIPGIGGSMLITKESKGLYSSDEGFKMAVTDALSTACKMIGVASDIYLGRWDGTQYKESLDPITPEQAEEIEGRIEALRIDKVKFLAYLNKSLKISITNISDIPAKGYDVAMASIRAKEAKHENS